MSDFFSDDFTAELKAYFLDSLIKETEKFIDLIDESLWKRIRSEVAEQCQAWAVDAKTNEFEFLAAWIEGFEERTSSISAPRDLIKILHALKEYAEALLVEKKDSAELASRFAVISHSNQEALFLHCKTGATSFAIPILSVVEISGKLPLFALPEQKLGILGVVPFRGEAIPVINLQDHGFASFENKNTYFVICEFQGVRFSLQVTETDDLIALRESELQNVDDKQFFIKANKSIMILNLEKLVA
ncbi:chemotaxis protein CheW [Bdellovibrio sp. 22V]|uniref:chemotaxis protein CheW n=1 Tax=Bdellovibrio TaxID=958 RepID=UPI002543C294|nr:chemotaxis protein CheW [Bdellovibrio sp. 22V]WII70709.1 chemotaxis protein CheW [Bdellovibrio sp. 22V]